MIFNKAGAKAQLSCLLLAAALLNSCGRSRAEVPHEDPNEAAQLIQATKSNPSLRPESNEAGPPIHVDPYPHSAGMMMDKDELPPHRS